MPDTVIINTTDTPPDPLGVFTIVVTAMGDEVLSAVRVRRWLKTGLRGYGLRCRVIRYTTGDELTAPGLDLGDDADEGT